MAELCTVAIYHGLNSPLLLETLTRPGMILPCSATLYPLHLRLVEADCLLKGSDFHLVTHLHLAKTRQLLLSFMMLEPSHLLSYYNSTGHNASSDLGDNCPGEHCPRRPKFFFDPNNFWPKTILWPKNFFLKLFLTQIWKNYFFLTKKFLPTFFDYIFNYKNSLTSNQMGFDTIEINLVMYSCLLGQLCLGNCYPNQS